MREVPSLFKRHAKTELKKGRQPEDVLKELVLSGIPYDLSLTLLGNKVKLNTNFVYNTAFYQALSKPHFLTTGSPHNVEKLEDKKAQVYCIDNYFPDEDCERVINLSKQRLFASDVIGVKEKQKLERQSKTCLLAQCDPLNTVVIDKKLTDTMAFGHLNAEQIQVQQYQNGDFFNIHSDYFAPGSPSFNRANCPSLGQRSWTFMVYLNDVESGGETEFPLLNLSVTPKRGRALIWNNLLPNGYPNKKTKHLAHPVISGEKSIITKWFRDKLKPNS